ncbi:DNA primase [Spongisporangium articulatum]|uniref:DNA primase n=1 Tax=Spongisporangium articulatum TaxID=3362603 RepID=A0ABW8ANJ9_9ACTN
MRIRREDVDAVRERSRIDEVVGEYVALRPGGVGSMKGLCPFHDEKTPSFHVRPAVGLFHCFGCDAGGDVIAFLQQINHLTFTEAVERLADKAGITLRYEDDGSGKGGPRREGVGQRQRLLEAHRVVQQFYAEQLATPDALQARQFLTERGFDRDAAAHFGCGFAPKGGEVALRHLRGRGFTEDELLASGIAGQGRRGLYDRFRGRLVWPIRDVTGDTVGFGARRIFEDDSIEAKYLNTPETTIYKKSQVLYGVDLAKREIGKAREVVVVEGYTDVMACHLAGVPTAVATCGTAFGADHIRIVRRLLGDDDRLGGRVVFTFDGDAAGQKAALRAFEEDQRFVAQTYIAVARDNMDPCDLRQKRGDEAVRELIASRTPLFEFAIKSTLARVNLETAEGRVQGLRAVAPMVAAIRDPSLRPEYGRMVAGWLGMEIEAVQRAVKSAARSAGAPDQRGARPGAHAEPDQRPQRPVVHRPDPRDPVARIEREALECLLQVPRFVPAPDADALNGESFRVPVYRAVHDAIRAAGGMSVAAGLEGPAWVEAVLSYATPDVAPVVTELAVAPLPADTDETLAHYAAGVVLRMVDMELVKQIGDLRSLVQRLAPTDDGYQQAFADLLAIEGRRRSIKERMNPS